MGKDKFHSTKFKRSFNTAFLSSFLALAFSASQLPSIAQAKTWEFEQIDSLQMAEPKPVLIFIKAGWCRYCVAMEQTVFNAKSVIELINEKVWFIILDGETKRDILFRGETYSFIPTGNNAGSHELAEALANIKGQIAFPTTTILNSKNEIIFQAAEFIDKARFSKLLKSL